jgi:hypothetical protein
MNCRIIQAPTENTIQLLERKMHPDSRHILAGIDKGAVAIIQSTIPNLFYYADIAGKAANVTAIELTGNCPQTMSNISIWGKLEAVQCAVDAIDRHENC